MPAGDVVLDAAARAGEGAQIYSVRVADGETRRLTEGAGDNDTPLAAPDGTRIAWICAPGEPAFYTVRKVCVMGRMATIAKCWADCSIAMRAIRNGAPIRARCIFWPTITVRPTSTRRAPMARCGR